MGRKKVTKKVEVEAEQSEEEQEVKEEKPKKGAKGKASFDLKDILSETFRGRLTQYIALNQEVLTLRGKDEGTDKTE